MDGSSTPSRSLPTSRRPGAATYCASKAAVVALTVGVAQEVATDGITVNAVCPGPTDTLMLRLTDAAWNEWKIQSLPMKRVGQPVEIAWAYMYLACGRIPPADAGNVGAADFRCPSDSRRQGRRPDGLLLTQSGNSASADVVIERWPSRGYPAS